MMVEKRGGWNGWTGVCVGGNGLIDKVNVVSRGPGCFSATVTPGDCSWRLGVQWKWMLRRE